jgi:MFS family permease
MSDFGPPGPPHPPSPYGGPPSWGADPARTAPVAQPGDPYASGATPTPARSPGLAARLGDRLRRRPEPRFAVALAGAGAVLALVGLFAWAGDRLGSGFTDSSALDASDNNTLGGFLFLGAAVVGLVLAVTRRTGPLATAGLVLAAGGVPLALIFFTFDVSSGGAYPFNLDAVVWVSIAFWLVGYLALPGLRGHTVLVFLIASTFFDYVLFKSAQSELTSRIATSIIDTSGDSEAGAAAVTAVGLLFGLAYYGIAWALDRRGHHGPATGLVYPAFGALVTGLIGAGIEWNLTTAGVLTVVVGALGCLYGGRYGRRATCLFWAAGIAIGVGIVVGDNIHDSTGAGITLAVIGVVLVVLAQVAAAALHEPDDMDTATAVPSR